MSEKIIFLDIDGPMIPATMLLVDPMSSAHRAFPPTTIAVLNKLCERTGAKVVFNTAHNVSWDGAPNIESAIVAGGLEQQHIRAADFKTMYPDIPRDVAVRSWLKNHADVSEWVAIDDTMFIDDERLVFVDSDAGLHVGHLNQAIEKLGGKPVVILM